MIRRSLKGLKNVGKFRKSCENRDNVTLLKNFNVAEIRDSSRGGEGGWRVAALFFDRESFPPTRGPRSIIIGK